MAKQTQDKHTYVFCARVPLGNIRRKISFKNPGFWNAYYYTLFTYFTYLLTYLPGADPGFSEGGVWTQRWISEAGGLCPPEAIGCCIFEAWKLLPNGLFTYREDFSYQSGLYKEGIGVWWVQPFRKNCMLSFKTAKMTFNSRKSTFYVFLLQHIIPFASLMCCGRGGLQTPKTPPWIRPCLLSYCVLRRHC